MFLSNKYTDWYNSIISKCQSRSVPRGYTENHHILPRAFGGDDSQANMVRLTAKEHFIVHLLLTKMTTGSDRHKMVHCVAMMSGYRTIKSRLYERLRKEHGEIHSKARKGKGNPFYGRKHSAEARAKMITNRLPPTPEQQLALKITRTKWRNSQANKSLWYIADELYNSWIELKKQKVPYPFLAIEKEYELKKWGAQNLVEHFTKGWIPKDDPAWVLWHDDYTP